MKGSNGNIKLISAFILTVFLAGFNAIGVRYTVLELAPFWGATLRFVPAALILFLMVFLFKLPLPRGRALLGAVLFGVLNFGGSFAFLYNGLIYVQPGMAQVILAMVPLFTIFFTVAHHQEKFRWRALMGAFLSVAGIAIVFQEQLRSNVPVFSLAAIMMGAVCFAEAGVLAKNFPKSHPISTNAIGMAAGAVVLFLMSIIWGEKQVLPVLANTWIALVYLILFGSCVIFVLFLYILKQWPASIASYQFVLPPFVTLIASSWITHETLNRILLFGAVLVLAGVLVGILSSPRKKVIPQVIKQPCTDESEVGC